MQFYIFMDICIEGERSCVSTCTHMLSIFIFSNCIMPNRWLITFH